MIRLTTEMLMTLRPREPEESFKSIYIKVKLFEALVWFPVLQGIVSKSDSRGMRGSCRGVEIMTWRCAGRCLIQLECGEHRVTLITADDEKPWQRDYACVAPNMGPMGIQSIDADAIEAETMLYKVIRWVGDLALLPSESVTIG